MKKKSSVSKVVVKESAKSISRAQPIMFKSSSSAMRKTKKIQTATGWRRSMERQKAKG